MIQKGLEDIYKIALLKKVAMDRAHAMIISVQKLQNQSFLNNEKYKTQILRSERIKYGF
ncbi:hypothetical protein IV79_GL001807 [Pediococcus claussenii]|nr:hypothetical protein IV79_GL001807 [Pediococcus claussenii]